MIGRLKANLANYIQRSFSSLPEYLLKSHGVIHIGANDGREAHTYSKAKLDVVWVEAIPQVYARLAANIAPYPRQVGYNYLLLDSDGERRVFHVADNNGASSSLFKFADHEKIWPHVKFCEDIELTGYTLPTMVEREGVDLSKYDCLVLDTQGAELVILKGAQPCLGGFRYILAEAADFESYAGGATLSEIVDFLDSQGFDLVEKFLFAEKPGVGSYFDALFKQRQ